MPSNPQYDIVIHNGTLMTVNETFDVIPNGLLGIKNGVLEIISTTDTSSVAAQAETIIDAEGGIIMPGLVNTHTHSPMTLFRGLADDLPLGTWLNDHIFPAEARHINPEFVRWATSLACCEMVLGGVTTCCDGYFHEDVVATAFDQFGMRAVAGQGIIDFPAPGVPDPTQNLSVAKAYAEKVLAAGGNVRPSLFCHSPYTCSAETLRKAKDLARELGVLFQIHVAETKSEVDQCHSEHSASPVEYLDQLGILDENTLLVHAVWVTDADIERMAESRVSISHCPESNMKLGAGIAPVARMLAADIRVGLGTDGCASNNNLDLMGEMDIVAKIHKVVSGDPTALDACTAVRMATIDGARAIGLGDRIGSLEAGKAADVIIVNTRQPHLTPLYNPHSHDIYAARAADVDTVLIDGKIIVSKRQIQTASANDIMEAANRLSAQVKEGAAGKQ